MKRHHLAIGALAVVVAGCSAGTAASPGTVTVTAPPSIVTITVTAGTTTTTSSAVAAASSPASAAPAAEGAYLAGATDVQFPAGDPGAISIVAQGDRTSGAYGTQWPVVIRNNTGEAVCDIKADITAKSAGTLVGSNSLDSLTPTIVQPGEIAFGHAYLETAVPDDAEIAFDFSQKKAGGTCYGRSAFVDDVNAVPGAIGRTTLVGTIRAGDQKITGPISIDILCMDQDGGSLAGGGNDGFADQDALQAGQSGSFSVAPLSATCDRYLVGSSGYGF